jgi:hypothetical protein
MTATAANPVDLVRLRFQQASHPVLRAWIERNPDRTRILDAADFEELLALQDNLGSLGVEGVVARFERRRLLVQRVATIASTEYLDLLEQLVSLIFDKIAPKGDKS